MEAPANTLNYMIAGYAVFFVVLGLYLVSLVIRWRNLRQDEALIENLEDNKPVQVSDTASPRVASK